MGNETSNPRRGSSNEFTSSPNATTEAHAQSRNDALPPIGYTRSSDAFKNKRYSPSNRVPTQIKQPSKPIREPRDLKGVNAVSTSHTGSCIRFDTTKRFGFIRMDDGSGNVFVHSKEIIDRERAMQEGDALQFEIAVKNDQRKAINVRYISNDTYWTKQTIEKAITDAILNCGFNKCVSVSTTRGIQYISPQELTQYLPPSLEIDRYKHVRRHHGGQWEIRNRNIHCYLGFQVVSNDNDMKRLLRHLNKKKAEKFRGTYPNRDDEKKETFAQPSEISESLLDFYDVPSEWTMNANSDGFFCFFTMPKVLDPDETKRKLEIKPYVNCVKVNYKIKQNTLDASGQRDVLDRSQKYENPPDAPPKKSGRKCYRCGEIGHLVRECPVENKDKCNRCGGIGHWARDCVMVSRNDAYAYDIDDNDGAYGDYRDDARSGDADKLDGVVRWQKTQNPPEASAKKSDKKYYCYRCGESGHLVRECPLENNDKRHEWKKKNGASRNDDREDGDAYGKATVYDGAYGDGYGDNNDDYVDYCDGNGDTYNEDHYYDEDYE